MHLVLTEPYDVAVVDLMLPKLDGLTLIEEVRRNNIDTPVLILSAKRSVDDRVKGLKTGSDDYLVKAYTESINGAIHVESTLNRGSLFTLRFAHEPS